MLGVEQQYKSKINVLLQLTQAINSNFNREQILKIFEAILKNQLHLDAFAVFSKNNGQFINELLHGVSKKNIDAINLSEFAEKIHHNGESFYFTEHGSGLFNAVVSVSHKEEPLAFVLIGFKETAEKKELEQDYLPFIQALANIIYVAFENKKLAKDQLERERMTKELELASQMQAMLLPDHFPKNDGIECDAFYKSHEDVGGDYYDFFKISKFEYGICMADVSGKGISAAMLMSNFQANVRALFVLVNSIKQVVNLLNKKVINNAKGEKFITAFLAKYNCRTRVLHYVNAGHTPAIAVVNNKIQLLRNGSIGLGMLDEMPFINKGRIKMKKNALLVCYTDGITELENEKGSFLGIDALKSLIYSSRMLSPNKLTTEVILKLEKYKGNNPYNDDLAFLASRFH